MHECSASKILIDHTKRCNDNQTKKSAYTVYFCVDNKILIDIKKGFKTIDKQKWFVAFVNGMFFSMNGLITHSPDEYCVARFNNNFMECFKALENEYNVINLTLNLPENTATVLAQLLSFFLYETKEFNLNSQKLLDTLKINRMQYVSIVSGYLLRAFECALFSFGNESKENVNNFLNL